MSKQEIKIITKIVNELTLFFMIHGYYTIKQETRYEEKATLFVITVATISPSLLQKIRKKVDRERELEIETYGWELIGDIDSHSELEILGHLIDEMHVEHGDATTTITFVRKNRYKD